MATNQPIVFFDGVCNFCNYWVRFILKREKKKNLLLSPLQGKTAASVLSRLHLHPTPLNSVILVEGERVWTQSSAALRICKYLGGGWKLFYGFIIVPKFLRDFVYNIIARNRYRWFGKSETCMVPRPEDRERFLE